MATSTSNTRGSKGQARGIKKLGDQYVYPGDKIVTQKGFKWYPKHNVHAGKDYSIHASVEGIVNYEKRPDFFKRRVEISVIPTAIPNLPKFQVSPPHPYTYHPEQFPELAHANPEPWARKKGPDPEPKFKPNLLTKGKKIASETMGKSFRREMHFIPEHYYDIKFECDMSIAEQRQKRANDLEEQIFGNNYEDIIVQVEKS